MQTTQSTTSRNQRRSGPQHISTLMQVLLARYNIDFDMDLKEEEPTQRTLFDADPQDSTRDLVAHF